MPYLDHSVKMVKFNQNNKKVSLDFGLSVQKSTKPSL